jgi:hypothetical protein
VATTLGPPGTWRVARVDQRKWSIRARTRPARGGGDDVEVAPVQA